MSNFLLILIAASLGLSAHLARKRVWLEWILRSVIFIAGLFEFLCITISSLRHYAGYDHEGYVFAPQNIFVLTILCPATWLLLFMPIRQLASAIFTGLNLLITGQVLLPLIRKKLKATEYFWQKRIFVPDSFPHLMALFIYITAAAYLLIGIHPEALNIFGKTALIPSAFEHFLSSSGLILLSFCGVGVWVFRSGKETLQRLGLTKLSKIQIGVGIFLIFASFTYDALWAIYTHHLAGQDLATELAYYNPGTFMAAGAFLPSVIFALVMAVFTGLGEEILIRGALQPVFGILPSALLHGLFHAQFAQAPVFIVKVTIWSIFMSLVRRYTNTTTTIIAHVGFNLITILLFAANP